MQRLNDEQQALIEDNIRLAYYMARKWSANLPPRKIDEEEVQSLCTLALCKAAAAFKKEKGVKFATFAARCMDNEVLMCLRKMKNNWMIISLEHAINEDQDGNCLTLEDILSTPNDLMEEWMIKETLPLLLDALNERERSIMDRIYFQEEPQRTVGADLGLSQSYISRIRKNALKNMHKEAMKDKVAWF